MTSIISAGLLSVLEKALDMEDMWTHWITAYLPIQRPIVANGRHHDDPITRQLPHLRMNMSKFTLIQEEGGGINLFYEWLVKKVRASNTEI